MTRSQLRIVDQGILSHDPTRGAYMPSITALDDGTWIACQHVGSKLGSADNRIEVLRSSDGRQWHQQGCMHELDDRWAYRGPDIEQLPDGRLVMTATRFEVTDAALFDPDSEGLQRPEMLLFWSQDQGANWSPPQIVPVDLPPEKYTWNKAGRLIQCSPTRWLYTFETWKPEGYDGPPDQKAAVVISTDQGQTWGELTVMADDRSGKLLWWDQMNAPLVDGRLYVMLWTHRYGTKEDLADHWIISVDEGRTWSEPQPTNLPGQVCCPIALPDGRVAAIYNHRGEPQGIRVALSEDLSTFDREGEVVVFDAGTEATFGKTDQENFLAEHLLIAFGKPQGIYLADGSLLTFFWCTSQGVTHTRWVRLAVD
ncbi:MAG: sialidase family protein [Planctomycetota bacterium]